MLEHIVTSNLTKHLTNSDILFELQHGFREKRSCEMQLVMLIYEIAKNMQTEKQTDLILLDFNKAFDKVAHEKPISKLHGGGRVVRWCWVNFQCRPTNEIALLWNSGQNIQVG